MQHRMTVTTIQMVEVMHFAQISCDGRAGSVNIR